MPDLSRLPFFDALADADTVLLAGMGGGYDIFSGLPLYFALRNLGKTVHLANLSFSPLYGSTGEQVGDAMVVVTDQISANLRYFPEFYLARWFRQTRGEAVPIYCFDHAGARPIAQAYRLLVERLGGVDALVLVDGGTDSLMRGDETGLGTPAEDMASLYAAHFLEGVPTKLLVNIGFGVDRHHGVCHAQFLEAVAALATTGDFLGAWSLTAEMPEATLFRDALRAVHRVMAGNPSIVAASIQSAVEGRFGDYHTTYRTQGSTLFINPLMSLYWAFSLDAVARRCLYLDRLGETETLADVIAVVKQFRSEIQDAIKPWKSLPM